MRVYIGTSGYNYPEWRGSFYPEGFPAKKMFAFYSEHFRAVEINYTFYRMPTLKTTEAWCAQAPEGFSYVLKAPRRITHDKRLKDCADTLQFFCESARALGPHLGPLLFQLPPNLTCDVDRLRAFLELLPHDMRAAFEFRHESWYDPRIFDLLAEHDAALCLSDHASAPAPREVTASWVYVRNHGPSGRYHGSYSDEALAEWAESIARWRREGRDVWCFFDNDVKSAAPQDAQRLLDMLKD